MRAASAARLKRRTQRGMALLMVLGLVLFLTVVALEFAESQRLGSAIASNQLAAVQAQAAADGAIHRMLVELQRTREPDNPDNPAWRPNGRIYRWQEGDLRVQVSARSEAANIDLNFAAEPLLKQLFVSAGASDAEAASIVAAIRDWTDADNLTRPGGAEADQYRAAGRKVLPTNELFVAVEELKDVLGVTPELYAAVAPRLTVHSRSAGVDPQVAPLDVLLAVPGLDPALVSAWVAERDAAIEAGEPIPPMPFRSPYFVSGGFVVRISAQAATPNGVVAERTATVRVATPRRVAPQFLAWSRPRVVSARPVAAGQTAENDRGVRGTP
ncbi:MAG: general secretion pathway protein GspK [Casimicrobiaceae bacterium]|nr:general secretion pathway protein GspK [Casimicrobiaceae bacterium]MCX8097693.1 general secretion pathway protein GspK [Casimicrobiaceae bacterium]MDW8312286.1 type II secretion system protein GspK [Burkholderiales bacterium]